MAGIIHKIEEKLGMGGKKEEVKKPEHGYGSGESHQKAEHKEGMAEKIKDKISGGDHNKQADHGYGGDHHKQAEHGYGDHDKKHDSEHKDGKKKKKDKKKGEHGHHKDGHSSSSSDSD